MKMVFGSRQFRFASLSQICTFNSEVVQDTIMDYSICELFILQNYDISEEEFRLGFKSWHSCSEHRLITITAFRLCARVVSAGPAGDGRRTCGCVLPRICATTLLSGYVGDPLPKSRKANSKGSKLLGSFSGLANIFYSLCVLVKG